MKLKELAAGKVILNTSLGMLQDAIKEQNQKNSYSGTMRYLGIFGACMNPEP